jgi:hypothetical protein
MTPGPPPTIFVTVAVPEIENGKGEVPLSLFPTSIVNVLVRA